MVVTACIYFKIFWKISSNYQSSHAYKKIMKKKKSYLDLFYSRKTILRKKIHVAFLQKAWQVELECGKQWAPRSVCALNNGYWMAYHLFLKEWLRESSSYYVILFCKYWLLKNVMLIKTSQNNSIRKTKGPNHFQSCLFFQGLFAQKVSLSQLRSLYLSRAVSNFYGTEIEIWAGFGPVGSTEKNLGRL